MMVKVNMHYVRKLANKPCDEGYYKSDDFPYKEKYLLQKEEVTKKLEQIEKESRGARVFYALKKIYQKNLDHAFYNTKQPINSDLLILVADINLLITAYDKVRKNLGLTTLVYKTKKDAFKNMNSQQKNLLSKNDAGMDDIDMLKKVSELIKKGKYSWGTSKIMYIEKPGKTNTKTLLTIPLFMDLVLQTAIKMVLEAIYEPYFDKMNCSFGFRPNKSRHDAILLLTSSHANGLKVAIKGDIKSIYDTVCRKKLIEILGRKIKDRKFLNLIEQRLAYEFYDSEKRQHNREELSVPQCAADSQYLWNIYMMEFDEFITSNIQKEFEEINIKIRGSNLKNKELLNEQINREINRRIILRKILNWIRKMKNEKGNFLEELKNLYKKPEGSWKEYYKVFEGVMIGGKKILKELNIEVSENEKDFLKRIQKYTKNLSNNIFKMSYFSLNKIRLRMIYVRFADEWIILSNIKKDMVIQLKEKVAKFLKEELKVTFSEEKTLITNIKEKPVYFLGFEIRSCRGQKVGSYIRIYGGNKEKVKVIVTRSKVFAGIDKQRQIDTMYLKGFCKKNGDPKELSRLINLDAFSIIERYNSYLTVLTNSYANFIKNPRSDLNRWVYILRYSCLKTLAQKYKLSLRGVFKKFRPEKKDKDDQNTVEIVFRIKMGDEVWKKSCKLHTLKTLIKNAKSLSILSYRIEKENTRKNLEKGIPIKYEEKTRNTRLNDGDYLEKINWFNFRTLASFKMSCLICGVENQIKMHYIKYTRKTSYDKIKANRTQEQVMSLRNVKQIRVCRSCHKNAIYKGNYDGMSLGNFLLPKMYDDRINAIESYSNKIDFIRNYQKNFLQKGWIKEK